MSDGGAALSDHRKPNFPASGLASTYADSFAGKSTADGETCSHQGYSRLTYKGRQVIVRVNDRGGGKTIKTADPKIGKVTKSADEHRVLDLSRAAMAFLIGQRTQDITDQNASVITLDKIEIMPPGTKSGPVMAKPGVGTGGNGKQR